MKVQSLNWNRISSGTTDGAVGFLPALRMPGFRSRRKRGFIVGRTASWSQLPFFLLIPGPPTPETLLSPELWALEQLVLGFRDSKGQQTPLWHWGYPCAETAPGAFWAVYGQTAMAEDRPEARTSTPGAALALTEQVGALLSAPCGGLMSGRVGKTQPGSVTGLLDELWPFPPPPQAFPAHLSLGRWVMPVMDTIWGMLLPPPLRGGRPSRFMQQVPRTSPAMWWVGLCPGCGGGALPPAYPQTSSLPWCLQPSCRPRGGSGGCPLWAQGTGASSPLPS